MRIIGSRIGAAGPDPDEASVADQARRDLAASSSRPDLPAAFSELHQALATRLTDGGVRYALLQTLLLVSRDWRREKGNAPNPYQSAAGPHLSLAAPQPSLRAAGAALDPFRPGGPGSGQLIQGGQQMAPLPGEGTRGGAGGGGGAGALVVRSEQGRAAPCADLMEYEVPEALLVRDVVFACQGIDGRYVKYSGASGRDVKNNALLNLTMCYVRVQHGCKSDPLPSYSQDLTPIPIHPQTVRISTATSWTPPWGSHVPSGTSSGGSARSDGSTGACTASSRGPPRRRRAARAAPGPSTWRCAARCRPSCRTTFGWWRCWRGRWRRRRRGRGRRGRR